MGLLTRLQAAYRAFAAPSTRAVSPVTAYGLPLAIPVAQPVRPTSAPQQELKQWAGKTVERIRSAAWGGRLRILPYLDNNTEETAEIRTHYPVMLKEAVIKSGFLTKVLSVASLEPHVTPVDQNNPRDVEIATFVKHNLQRIEGGMPGLGWRVLSGMLVQGWSLNDKVYKVEDTGRFRGKWVWKTWKAKDTSRLSLLIDAYKNVTGIRSTGTDAGEVFDPKDFVLATHLGLYENPTGCSDFRAAYRPYWIKNTVWQLRGLHLDKFTSPFLKGTYTGPDMKPALEEALEQARSGTWISIPAGALVEAVEMSTRGTADFKDAIQDCDREMLIALVGSYLHILEGQIANGRGDTGIHRETSELYQWMLAAVLTQVLNEQAVPELVALNYAGAEPPLVTLGSISDVELQASLKVDQGLQEMGFRHSRRAVASAYGREEATDQADVLSAAAATPVAQGA